MGRLILGQKVRLKGSYQIYKFVKTYNGCGCDSCRSLAVLEDSAGLQMYAKEGLCMPVIVQNPFQKEVYDAKNR